MGTYLKFLKKYEKAVIRKKGLTITVSGFAASGKDTIAKEIARYFKLEFINAGDILRKFARKRKISLGKASKTLPAKVDHFIDEQMLKTAMKGGYVIAGRLAGWVAGDFSDCKIFIDCRKSVRIKRLSQRNNLTLSQAREMIERRDDGDQKRYQQLYGINLRQKKIYDLMVDNNKEGISEIKKKAIQMIKNFLKNKYDRRKKTRKK
ncbi:cytidylate kinase family protein [Patescibacteria group bacterium]|nr:cytidylate kinase family protein [Patescibacteria group bacterium]